MQSHLTKHQHFVPKFYLKYWCDEKEQLFVHKIDSGREFKTNRRNVAGRKFAYDTSLTLDPNQPDRFQYFEKLFSEIESAGEPVFAAIQDRVRRLNSPICLPPSKLMIPQAEISRLIRFMVIQILRGMEMRERMTAQWNTWCKKAWDATAPILFPDQPDDFDFDHVCEDWIKHSQMEFMSTRFETYSEAVEGKMPVFGLVKGPLRFYASDNPVHWTGFYLHPLVKWDGIKSPSCRIVYPLAPDVCAVFYDRDYYLEQQQYENTSRFVFEEEVSEFNHHLVLRALSEVYSFDGNFEAVKHTLNQKRISGEKWHGASEDEELDALIELLIDGARSVPKGYYTKAQWLSVIRQERNLPFGKMGTS